MNELTRKVIDLIDDNNMKPGDSLPSQSALCESFGVSRIAIRESMKYLEGQGVIETISGKGALVRKPDGDLLSHFFMHSIRANDSAFADLLELRTELEVYAAGLAALRRTSSEANELRKICLGMADNVNNPDHYAELDIEFHLAIARASRNEMLKIVMNSIQLSTKAMIVKGLSIREEDEDLQAVQTIHEEIVQAITENNREEAKSAMLKHFDNILFTMGSIND